MKIFMLGTGGWGIALAMLLHQNGHKVCSWTYLQEECDLLLRERANEKLLPGVKIPGDRDHDRYVRGSAGGSGRDGGCRHSRSLRRRSSLHRSYPQER